MPLFCRHNRYTAECPICSKGTALDSTTSARRPRKASPPPTRPEPSFQGPYAEAGPYDDAGESYQVRLERVPGGLRLAEWSGGRIRRRAPVLATADLPGLVAAARERGFLPEETGGEAVGQTPAFGVSRGRSGELRDELRVERLEGDRVRVGRWIMRPNRGWELQEAPVMLPPARYAEAIAGAGLASGTAAASRP